MVLRRRIAHQDRIQIDRCHRSRDVGRSPRRNARHRLAIDPQDGLESNGRQRRNRLGERIGRYEIYVSTDGSGWGSAVASGEWADTSDVKRASFTAKPGRYLKLRALSEAEDSGPWTSAAEINATGAAR
ncbi:discoidin domain-containing protein [Kibdelosporangium aridum]|uniref:discoidin domain-containing protein n=1 Tax=Kibdelosporangium aridum TaxID=2030 RepID=UPI003898F9D8